MFTNSITVWHACAWHQGANGWLSQACEVVVMVEVREVLVGLLWALALPALHSAAVHSLETTENSSKLS